MISTSSFTFMDLKILTPITSHTWFMQSYYVLNALCSSVILSSVIFFHFELGYYHKPCQVLSVNQFSLITTFLLPCSWQTETIVAFVQSLDTFLSLQVKLHMHTFICSSCSIIHNFIVISVFFHTYDLQLPSQIPFFMLRCSHILYSSSFIPMYVITFSLILYIHQYLRLFRQFYSI